MNQPPNLSAWLQIPNRIVFFEEQNFRALGKKFKRLVKVFTRLLTRALNANNKTRVLVSPYNSSWRELQPFWVFQRVEIDRIVAYCKSVVQHDCMVSRCCRKLVSHFHSCYRSNREWLKNLKCTQSKARMCCFVKSKSVYIWVRIQSQPPWGLSVDFYNSNTERADRSYCNLKHSITGSIWRKCTSLIRVSRIMCRLRLTNKVRGFGSLLLNS